MPGDPWNEAVKMLICFLMVAAVASPIGGVARRIARRKGEALLPRPRGWRVPWGGFEVFVAFMVLSLVVPTLVAPALDQSGIFRKLYGEDFPRIGSVAQADDEAVQQRLQEAATMRALWTGLVSLPLQIGLLIAFRSALYPQWTQSARRSGIVGSVALAVIAWAVIALVVLVIHFGVMLFFKQLNWVVDDHPLARITAARPLLDRILFALQACIAAPMLEEALFRGVLVPWLLGQKYRTWPVLVCGIALAATSTWSLETGPSRGPTVFAAGLLVGWVLLNAVIGKKRRTVGAIYTSAALFAAVHSNVWPSPIPLFVLGLGLGWLAVRTRGVLVPIIVHGLFNAVSVLFVLRGG